MGGCQNYGPFLGALNNKCRIIIGIQKGTIVLTTTHILFEGWGLGGRNQAFRIRNALVFGIFQIFKSGFGASE